MLRRRRGRGRRSLGRAVTVLSLVFADRAHGVRARLLGGSRRRAVALTIAGCGGLARMLFGATLVLALQKAGEELVLRGRRFCKRHLRRRLFFVAICLRLDRTIGGRRGADKRFEIRPSTGTSGGSCVVCCGWSNGSRSGRLRRCVWWMIRRRARLVIVVVVMMVGYVVVQEPFEFVKWTVLARVVRRCALCFVRLPMMIVLYCSTFVIVLLSRGRHIHRGDYGSERGRRWLPSETKARKP